MREPWMSLEEFVRRGQAAQAAVDAATENTMTELYPPAWKEKISRSLARYYAGELRPDADLLEIAARILHGGGDHALAKMCENAVIKLREPGAPPADA